MAAAIPTLEPVSITAGNTAKWTRSFSDYPASDGWVLSYAFLRESDGQPVSITATASGGDHLVNVDAGTTVQWMAGDYNGQGYVSKAGERYLVWTGRLTVAPDFVSAGAIDTRSQARRILAALDNTFEKLARKQVVDAVIEGVQFKFRSYDEFLRARNYWAGVVLKETGKRKNIYARFTNPQ